MKNQMLYVGFLVTLALGVSSAKCFASNDDKWSCRATCVAVSQSSRTLFNLGSASGRSEIDVDEAFNVMTQDCLNKATEKGMAEDTQVYLVKNYKIATDDKTKTVSSESSSKSFQLGFLVNFSKGSAQSQYSESEVGRGYLADT